MMACYNFHNQTNNWCNKNNVSKLCAGSQQATELSPALKSIRFYKVISPL